MFSRFGEMRSVIESNENDKHKSLSNFWLAAFWVGITSAFVVVMLALLLALFQIGNASFLPEFSNAAEGIANACLGLFVICGFLLLFPSLRIVFDESSSLDTRSRLFWVIGLLLLPFAMSFVFVGVVLSRST